MECNFIKFVVLGDFDEKYTAAVGAIIGRPRKFDKNILAHRRERPACRSA
jgi:hypothetical protein